MVMSTTWPMKNGSRAIDSSPILGVSAFIVRLRVPSMKNSKPVLKLVTRLLINSLNTFQYSLSSANLRRM